MKKKYAYISIFVLVSICNRLLAQEKIELNLENIWSKGAFNSKLDLGIRPLNNPSFYSKLKHTESGDYLISYSWNSGKEVDTILNSTKLNVTSGNLKIEDYEFSDDEKYILLTTDREFIYRHSFVASYYIYDVQQKKLEALSNERKQLNPCFSPNNLNMAYVSDRNIYIYNLENKSTVQITNDGKENQIINGSVDWVYEEEFSMHNGLFWNSNGTALAFYKFNETEVPEFEFSNFNAELYGGSTKYKYPKAGEKNSLVEIFVYQLNNKKIERINSQINSDTYYPRVKWTNDPTKITFIQLNRRQNHLQLFLSDISKKETKLLIEEKNETYIDVNEAPYFLEKNNQFLWLSEKNGYQHIYLFDLLGKEISQITSGEFEVIDIKKIDENKSTIYYLANDGNVMQKNIFSISFDGKNKKKYNLVDGYNDIILNDDNSIGLVTSSNSNMPAVQYFLDIKKIQKLRDLNENKTLLNTLNQLNLSPKEFIKIKTENNVELNAFIIKPHNFNPAKKYPLIIHIYGGPGSNTVIDRWGGNDFMWQQLMASKGYVIASIDNRGTMFRGKKFKDLTYKNLGNLERIDQANSAKFLGRLPYVDSTRIGIQGWSFGGYLSSLCITKNPETFKAAVAVAPVTNWKFYDNIYTERFLQTPQENPKGYEDNSPINFADKLTGNYFLIHGMADDNVHFQNAVEMIRALQKSRKKFDLMIYPDKNHGITGGNTRFDVYERITNWWDKNL
jgi:dipeptidyl-peptidase-4